MDRAVDDPYPWGGRAACSLGAHIEFLGLAPDVIAHATAAHRCPLVKCKRHSVASLSLMMHFRGVKSFPAPRQRNGATSRWRSVGVIVGVRPRERPETGLEAWVVVSAAGFEPATPRFIPLRLSPPPHAGRSWSGLSLRPRPRSLGAAHPVSTPSRAGDRQGLGSGLAWPSGRGFPRI
jgi:hypothetical protein